METPLSPLEFLRRARRLYPDREAVVDEDLHLTYYSNWASLRATASPTSLPTLTRSSNPFTPYLKLGLYSSQSTIVSSLTISPTLSSTADQL